MSARTRSVRVDPWVVQCHLLGPEGWAAWHTVGRRLFAQSSAEPAAGDMLPTTRDACLRRLARLSDTDRGDVEWRLRNVDTGKIEPFNG